MSKDNKQKPTEDRSAAPLDTKQENTAAPANENNAGQEQATVETKQAGVNEGEAKEQQPVDNTADKNEQEAGQTTGKPAANKSALAGKSEAAAPSGSGKGLSGLALLVALAGAGLSGWMWYQGQQAAIAPVMEPAVAAPDYGDTIKQQEQRLQKLEQQAGAYREPVERLEQQVARLPNAGDLAENQRLLVQLQSAQQAFTQRFEQAFGNTRQDWRLAEAEHLMRMAHLRLTALQDINSARYLLEAADQILFEQDDPAAYAAREALAQALTEVRALPKLDPAGVFMRLGALQKQVRELDQAFPEYMPGKSDTGGLDLSKLLDKVSGYIRLDINSTEDIQPLLSSQQLTHIRLAVSLVLEQAQWAALNGHQEVYDQALAQAIEFLSRYFPGEHQAAGSMRTQLQELAVMKISQQMPDINPALVALQNYVQERTLERRAPREAQQ